MSQNVKLERQIEIVEGLVREMENHHDQAKIFAGAASALKEVNYQIKELDKQFEGLNSNEIHDRLKAIEQQRDVIRNQLAEFKGEFKGLVDGLSGRVGTLKDDISELQASVQKSKSELGGRINQLEQLSKDALQNLNLVKKETADQIGARSKESQKHVDRVNQDTVRKLKEENQQMKEMITNHFSTMQKWLVSVAIIGTLAAGAAGYLLYLALSLPK
jgi:archaellum component FlaC